MRLTDNFAWQLTDWAQKGLTVKDKDVLESDLYRSIHVEESIDATMVGLGPEACVLLANIVATSKTLTDLDVFGNNISNKAEEFGKAIAASTVLTKLTVAHNNIGEYAGAFGSMIASLDTLRELNMLHNNIGEHAEEFGKAIVNSNVVILTMADNNIDESVSIDLLRAIIHSHSLQKVLGFEEEFEGGLEIHARLRSDVTGEIIELMSNLVYGMIRQRSYLIALVLIHRLQTAHY